MRRIIAPIVICLWIGTIDLFSQKVWSLDECIRYGVSHNLDMKIGENETEMAHNSYFASLLNFTPIIYAGLNRDIYPETCFTSTFQGTISLFEGLTRIYETKRAKTIHKNAELEREKREFDLVILITKEYLNTLLCIEMLRATEENYQITLEQLSKSKILVESGSSTYSDLLNIEYLKASEEVKIINLENSLSLLKISIREIINLPFTDSLNIKKGVESSIPIFPYDDPLEIFERALLLPQVKIARNQITQREYEKKIANGQLLPSLSVEMGHSVERDISTIGLSIKIPIFNRGNTLMAIKSANLFIENSKIEYSKMENSLYKNILQAYQEGKLYYEECTASESRKKAASEAFECAKNKFEVGEMNSTDYLVAKNNLFQAQSEAIQSKYKYLFQLKIIDYYCGNWKY